MLSIYWAALHRHNYKALPQDPEAAGQACQAGLQVDQEAPVDTLRLVYDVAHPSGGAAAPPPYVSSTCLLHIAWKYKPHDGDFSLSSNVL